MNEDSPIKTPEPPSQKSRSAFLTRVALWLGLLALVLVWCFPGEPMYEGIPLSEWLEDLNTTSPGHEALRQMGTSGIPCYLKMLSARDSSFKTSPINQLNKLPLVQIAPFNAKERH